MKKFKCYSEKEKDYPGFEIEGDFPDKIMICLPLANLFKDILEEIYLLIPEKENETK